MLVKSKFNWTAPRPTFWVEAETLGQSLVKDLISLSSLLVAHVRARERPQGYSNFMWSLWSGLRD